MNSLILNCKAIFLYIRTLTTRHKTTIKRPFLLYLYHLILRERNLTSEKYKKLEMEKRGWQMSMKETFLHHRNHNKYKNEKHIRRRRCIKNEKQAKNSALLV